MEKLSGSGCLPDYDSDQSSRGAGGSPVTNILVFNPFMLLFSCHSLTFLSSAFVLQFFSSQTFPLPSLRGGRQQGSVLIRSGKRSGDNRPAADIGRCGPALPGSPVVGVSRQVPLTDSRKGKQEADKETPGVCFPNHF